MLFVADKILPDNITCFEYLDSIRQAKSYKESDDTLEGLLEFAEIDKNANVGSLSVGERNRLLPESVKLNMKNRPKVLHYNGLRGFGTFTQWVNY